MLEKQELKGESLYRRLVTVVAAILVVVLGLLEVVLSLATKHGTCYGTEDAVAAHLVAAEVSGSTATKSTHQASVTFLLHSRITGSVMLLSRLTVRVLGILILTVGTLLRELILGLRTGVTSLLVLAILSDRDVSFCFETILLHYAYPCCCWL
jgi:hypothetical protein